jgi:hypothetical protein
MALPITLIKYVQQDAESQNKKTFIYVCHTTKLFSEQQKVCDSTLSVV